MKATLALFSFSLLFTGCSKAVKTTKVTFTPPEVPKFEEIRVKKNKVQGKDCVLAMEDGSAKKSVFFKLIKNPDEMIVQFHSISTGLIENGIEMRPYTINNFKVSKTEEGYVGEPWLPYAKIEGELFDGKEIIIANAKIIMTESGDAEIYREFLLKESETRTSRSPFEKVMSISNCVDLEIDAF